MVKFKEVILSLGANLGDRTETLKNALHLIESNCGEIIVVSSLYESEPIGFEAEELFYNCCVKIRTDLSPIRLLACINNIESTLGRIRFSGKGYMSRFIDIDIISYNRLVLNSQQLTIPHKAYKERKFVLLPLQEIANDFEDPHLKTPIKSLIENCKDQSEIKKIGRNIFK